jgi:hypothetical protein
MIKILINILLVCAFMSIFIYFFYFNFIVNIEQQKLNSILTIYNFKINIPEWYYSYAAYMNKQTIINGKIFVGLLSSLSFILVGVLIYKYYNEINVYYTFAYILYILFLSIIVEFVFLFIFTKNISIYTQTDVLNYIKKEFLNLLQKYF